MDRSAAVKSTGMFSVSVTTPPSPAMAPSIIACRWAGVLMVAARRSHSSNVGNARRAGDPCRASELLRHRFGLGDERPDGSVGNDPGGQPGNRPAQPSKSRHHQAGTLGFPGGNLISLASL